MKHLLALMVASIALMVIPHSAWSEEYTALPFPVSVGGQAAEKSTEATVPFANIPKPVEANAELVVGSKADPVIINIVAASDKGQPVEGAAPAILLIQGGGGKTTLDKTMDGKKLAAGSYLMSIVAEGKTASILLKIK